MSNPHSREDADLSSSIMRTSCSQCHRVSFSKAEFHIGGYNIPEPFHIRIEGVNRFHSSFYFETVFLPLKKGGESVN